METATKEVWEIEEDTVEEDILEDTTTEEETEVIRVEEEPEETTIDQITINCSLEIWTSTPRMYRSETLSMVLA